MGFRLIGIGGLVALIAMAWLLFFDRGVEDPTAPEVRSAMVPERAAPGSVFHGFQSPDEPGLPTAREDGWERAAPPGSYENEMILRFPGGDDRRRFLSEIAGLDIREIEIIPGTNIVRVRYGNAATGARLRNLLPPGAGAEYNQLVLSPSLPPPVEEVESGPFYGFGENLLRWLGIPDDHDDWGRGVTVAVLDTGIVRHPAFGGAFIPTVDMLGDRAAGFSYHGHGTAVASLVGGQYGVAPAANLLALRVLDGDGAGSSFHLAQGIYEAVNRGARVIPMALGTYGESSVLREAVEYALDRDVILLAAAGNEGVQGLPYPAAYEGVIAVTAIDAERRRPPFANVAPQVDIAAPGVGILAAWENEDYIEFSGTSAAVAVAGGAVAALLGFEPTLSSTEVAAILRGNADDTGAPGPDPETGAGVINLNRIFSRNESGIHDLALAGFHLSPGAREGNGPLQVVVQNRGTEPVRDVRVEVVFDGDSHQIDIGALDVNEVGVAEIDFASERLMVPGGVEIVARTFAPRVEDNRPENNVLGARIGLAPTEE